jgi:hypothetical protein
LTQILIFSGTTWAVPSDWRSSSNTIETIGAGGGGQTADAGYAGSGGGGGEYCKVTNLPLTPGHIVNLQVGTGGAAGTAGGATYFAGASIETSAVGAKGGNAGSDGEGGGGGNSGVGAIHFAGGSGGTNDGQPWGGAGGGGAAGPNGSGSNGGGSLSATYGGGGGGGNGSGFSTAGTGPSGNYGGTGGAATDGTAGGSGGAGEAASGSRGSGGGGSGRVDSAAHRGGDGGDGIEFDFFRGSGGGGGGGSYHAGIGGDGGAGGNYGGGGGGGAYGPTPHGAGGNGGDGIIVITYTAAETTLTAASSLAAESQGIARVADCGPIELSAVPRGYAALPITAPSGVRRDAASQTEILRLIRVNRGLTTEWAGSLSVIADRSLRFEFAVLSHCDAVGFLEASNRILCDVNDAVEWLMWCRVDSVSPVARLATTPAVIELPAEWITCSGSELPQALAGEAGAPIEFLAALGRDALPVLEALTEGALVLTDGPFAMEWADPPAVMPVSPARLLRSPGKIRILSTPRSTRRLRGH